MGPRVSAPRLQPSSLQPSREGRRRPLIRLTPLIDVVFILLVFFMLASSYLDWRQIALDPPAEAGGGASAEGALLVEVRPDALRLSGEVLSLEALAERVRARAEREPERRVLVQPERGVVLQRAVSVLDRLEAAGATKVSLARAPGA